MGANVTAVLMGDPAARKIRPLTAKELAETNRSLTVEPVGQVKPHKGVPERIARICVALGVYQGQARALVALYDAKALTLAELAKGAGVLETTTARYVTDLRSKPRIAICSDHGRYWLTEEARRHLAAVLEPSKTEEAA